MSLLDSDAEELKKNNGGEGTKSGRKVNQSGLGALRGLSKYSNLTAKYRTTGKAEPGDSKSETGKTELSVEHSRGTLTKSVQSQCEVSAATKDTTELTTISEVSAKSVQSQCDDIAPTLAVEIAEVQNNFESQCEVRAKSVQAPIVEDEGKLETEIRSTDTEVSAKSVHQIDEENLTDRIVVESAITAEFTKSVQSQCAIEIAAEPIAIESVEVSAKSVREETLVADNFDNVETKTVSEVSAKSVQSQGKPEALVVAEIENGNAVNKDQSQCEVSAMSVQIASALTEPLADVDTNKEFEVSAKSVQSQGKVSASGFALNGIFKPSKVSAKSVQSGGIKEKPPEIEEKNKVRAKSVRSQGKVSAAELKADDNVLNTKSKVITRNLDLREPTESVISIAGSQKVIVDFLFQLCLWNNSLITPPITKQQLVAETGLLEETALSSIKRLRNKHIIDRYAYKDGKAGWTQYQFSETSYKELVHLRQVGAKSVQPSMPVIPREFAPVNLEKKATASQVSEPKAETAEPNWFKNLDFTKVQPIGPMVVNATIRALVHQKLTPEIVQDFINRFTSWTSTQGRITSPIGLFCDKLKELAKEGDSPIFGCMTEEEREIEAAFAMQVEKAKAELDLIRKAKSVNAEREVEAEFEAWYSSASDSEKEQYAEPSAFAPLNSEAYKRILRAAYFEKLSLKE